MKIKGVYEHYGHKKTRLRYHIILVTKYRRKCLNDIKDGVFESFKHVEEKSKIKIHYMNLDKDHIHLMISFPPDYSLSQVINRLKQGTLNYLYMHYNDHLRKYYWSNKRKLWSDSFFASTVGMISESKVHDYIKNQG